MVYGSHPGPWILQDAGTLTPVRKVDKADLPTWEMEGDLSCPPWQDLDDVALIASTPQGESCIHGEAV